MIDLHLHSTASDGSFTPAHILNLAREKKINAISITDHDTIDGVKEVLGKPRLKSPDLISGVEISCAPPEDFKQVGSFHLLGYGFSVVDKKLNTMLGRAKEARAKRNPAIIQKLNTLGIPITLQQVENRFGTRQTGRPHIAELLKEKGVVDSFEHAFDTLLAKGKPAYVDKYRIPCQEAIQTILDAGGLAILAHPGLIKIDGPHDMEVFIDILIGYGLAGLEVYYTDHNDAQTRYYHELAEKKNLVMTGGSDFHGDFNEGVAMGIGNGNLHIDDSLMKKLAQKLVKSREQHVNFSNLEQNIGYQYHDRELLQTALCHRSYLNENKASCKMNNERLEFLGDAVLGLCIGHILMEKSPLKNEGELSKLRSSLVSEPALADMARKIDLGRYIKLGKGETASRGFDKNSILSDTFEAVIAAIYLDAGFEAAYKLINDLFSSQIEKSLALKTIIDYKSLLQERIQDKGTQVPRYTVLNEIGPDHDKTFEVSLNISGIDVAGLGKSKKAAEQDAARKILKQLKDR